MIKGLFTFGCGLIFGLGLWLSGMIRPSKVIAFLDLSGNWDPSLLLVMASAMTVYAITWRAVARRKAPLLGGTFPEPASRTVDARLLGGAALFGAGWGLGGICPGPALVSVTQFHFSLAFFAAMVTAMAAYPWLVRSRKSR
jgi:uncharacterized membrane protein YedE/YeeE